MKFMLLSDVHLRTTRPVGRIDDFYAAQQGKFRWVLETALSRGCFAILQAGDLFDSPVAGPGSFRMLSDVLDLLRNGPEHFWCIRGQHDCYMRSASSRQTPIDVLVSADAATILTTPGDIVSGASFGEPIAEAVVNPGGGGILVVHAMIGPDPLYPGQELMTPEEFVEAHPGFDLILCGDYHYRFETQVGGTLIVNTGCLVRLTRSERDRAHRPAVAVYDADDRSLEWLEVPCAPAEEVFGPDDPAGRPDGAVVKSISEASIRPAKSYRDVLDSALREHPVPQEVKDAVEEGLRHGEEDHGGKD